MVDQEYLIREINALSDSIRKKHQDLKQGVSERERFLETTFKPVVSPLKDIAAKLNHKLVLKGEHTENSAAQFVKGHNNIGTGENDEENESISEDVDTIEEGEGSDKVGNEEEEEAEEVFDDYDDDEMSSSSEQLLEGSHGSDSVKVGHRLSILGQDIGSKGLLTRKYILKMLHGAPSNRKYHIYGARLENDGIKIGDSLVDTDDDDNVKVKGKLFKGTPGLFELLFKNCPVKYSTRDLTTFKSILKLTNAHRRHYSAGSSTYRNKSKKYINIISKLFPPQRRGSKATGKGISLKSTYDTNIIYYNDINKLVERMKLLYEAKQSGHTGVDNELIALTEEMRSRGYIA